MTTVDLTTDQIGTLLTAMYGRLSESTRYVNNTEVRDEPGPTDLCCDWHRARWERDHEIHATLQQRVAEDRALIDLLEEKARHL